MAVNPKLNELTKQQRAERDIVMYAYDLALAEHNERCVTQSGSLDAEARRKGLGSGYSRDEFENLLIEDLQKGHTLGATFRDYISNQLDGATDSYDFSGAEIEMLPSAKTDEGNERIDEIISSLYREYTEYETVPVVPFDENEAGVTNAYIYGMHIDASDYTRANLYTKEAMAENMYVRTVAGDMSEPDSFMPKNMSSNYESLLATKAVLTANEYLKEHDVHMTITQAQKLRDAIRIDASDGIVVEQSIENVIARTENYLYESGLMKEDPTNPEDAFSNYATREGSPLDAYNLSNETILVQSSDLKVVDVFGTRRIGKSVIGVAETDTVHAFINDNYKEQQRVASEIHDLKEEGPNGEVRMQRINSFAIGPNDYLVSDNKGLVYHTDGAQVFSLKDEEVDDLGPEFLHSDYYAIGKVMSENDRLGISRLRKYVKSDRYEELDVQSPENINLEVQHAAIDNAIAILDELDRRGVSYEIMRDERDTQLKAKCKELGLDIRIVDTQGPNYVSRVYGDNSETYFSADIAASPAAGAKNKAHPNIIENPNGDGLSYMPTPEEAVYAVRYRLGDVVELKDIPGKTKAPILGEAGPVFVSSDKPVSGYLAERVTGASYTSSSNSRAEVGTIETFWEKQNADKTYTGIVGKKNTVVYLSSKISGRQAQTLNLTPDEAYNNLEEMMQTARDNFTNQVFGEMREEIDKVVPNYEKDNWTSYRKTPKTEEEKSWARDAEGYLLDPATNERIVWRNSSRKQELKEAAGTEIGDTKNVELSYDPVVRTLQENYLNYIEHDDAVLRGVVDGVVVEETMAEFNARISSIRESENMEVDAEVQAVFDALGLEDEHYTKAEKLDHVQQQFGQMSEKMFGHVDEDGKMHLNVANIIKYGGFEEKDVFRTIQSAKKEYDLEFVADSDEFTMNRLRENTASFDAESAVSILDTKALEYERPFLAHASKTMKETFATSGCSLETLEIDDKGIVHYVAVRENMDTRKNGRTRIEGQIGQIFEPDERGVIITKFDHDANYAIVPGYKATIQPGEGSMESRMRLKGYQQMLDDQLKKEIRSQLITVKSVTTKPGEIAAATPVDSLNSTCLNSVYRHLNDEKMNMDYMAELKGKGFSDELANAYIKTLTGAVRFDSSLIEESTINASLDAKKSNMVDDKNANGFSVTHRDISCLEMADPGYFDPIATASSTTQGASRYLSDGAVVNTDGSVTPAQNEADYDCALMKMDVCRNNKFNPFDRQMMVFSNMKQALAVEDNVKVAHVTLQGWNMDDGNVISKEFADRHLVPSHNSKVTENLNPDLIQYRQRDAANPDDMKYIEKDFKTHVEFMGQDYTMCDSEMVMLKFGKGDELAGKTRLVPVEALSEYDGRTFESEEPRMYSYQEQIKQQLIENEVGLRPMQVGDKICDMNGNKGVVNLIVDRDMSDELAERLKIKDAVELYRANPDLDIVSAPFTAPSRFNGGTVRGMMFAEDGVTPDAEDLHLADGSTIKGAIGKIPIIITDKTVDEKTHVYDDDDYESGKGRKASSQGAWCLQAYGCYKLHDALYKDNASNLVSVREKMIALGCDMDAEGNMHLGYTPHKLPNGTMEERPHISFDTSDISVSLKQSTSNKNGYDYVYDVDGSKIKQAKEDAITKLSASGGMMEIPFPVKLASGEETAFDAKSGKYLLPVLPVQYRTEQQFDDGQSMTHVYTRQYKQIAEAAIAYDLAMKKTELKESNPSLKVAGVTPSLEDIQKDAQKAYDSMASELEKSFEGKTNVWKHNVMSHRLPNSATAVWTADPRLELDEICMSQEMANSLGFKEGDLALCWRDPLLRKEGMAGLRVVIRDPEDTPMEGVAVNPAMDKRFDGDFDGDSIAIVNPRQMSLKEREFLEAYMEADDKDKKDIMKQFGVKSENAVNKLQEKAAQDAEVVNEMQEKLSVANTLCDSGVTPDKPKSIDEINFALNMGLDIASASAKQRAEAEANGEDIWYESHLTPSQLAEIGHTVADEDTFIGKDKNGNDVTYAYLKADEMEDIAKMAILKDKNEYALSIMNDYCKETFDAALASDAVQYGSFSEYFESMNVMIAEHKAKGKIPKLEDVAAYLNVRQNPDLDSPERLLYTTRVVNGEEVKVVDTSKPFVDFVDPAIRNNGKSDYYVENNGKREAFTPDADFAAECELRRQDMIERYKQVELATAIKSHGTGNAGSYSQRAVKGVRDGCILDALETTYGATQGLLQAKHSAIEAEQKYTILRETLPALWKGQRIEQLEDGSWVPMRRNDKPVYATREEWVNDYKAICDSKQGLDFGLDRSRIDNLSRVLYDSDDPKASKLVINVYDKQTGCTLDRLAYGGNAQTMYEACRSNENIYSGEMNKHFKPEGAIAVESRSVSAKIQKELSQSYSTEGKQEAKEAAAEQLQARQEAAQEMMRQAAGRKATKTATSDFPGGEPAKKCYNDGMNVQATADAMERNRRNGDMGEQ